MAARGGARTGAGRPKGAANKATADIKAAAAEYSDAALNVLVTVAKNTKAPAAARVAAANAILDRAHGKPKQSIEAEVGHPLKVEHVIPIAAAATPEASPEDYETD